MKEFGDRRIKRCIVILFSLLLAGNNLFWYEAYAQTKRELINKKNEAVKEINMANELLKKTEQNKKSSVNQLALLNRKIRLRDNIIENTKRELTIIEKQINENQGLIGQLEADLKQLKEEYARMIYYAYLNRKEYQQLAFIFAAEDINQAYKRTKYMQQYNEFRRKQAGMIVRMEGILRDKIDELEEYKSEKVIMVKENENEKLIINNEKRQQNTIIRQLQGRERELRKELAEKERIARELDRQIQAIIEAETRNLSAMDRMTPEERLLADNFKSNKGRLPWPTERGVITGRFGVQEHPVLKGVKIENYGIDISTVESATVRSVFEGEVKKVIGIPGANQAVIIQHGNYFSVYQNLVNVMVKTGDKVATKEAIGKVYTDKSNEKKTVLNFMIWEEKQKLDPAPWLSGN